MTPAELKTRFPLAACCIELPLPPKELSPNARPHFMARANKARAYRELARLRGLALMTRPLWKRARMQYVWLTKTVTRPDGDNALASIKAALDGLTDAGLFANDRGLYHDPIQFEKDAKNPRVMIFVTPMDEAIAFAKAALEFTPEGQA